MHLYIDNIKKDSLRFADRNVQLSTSTTGHIVLGRNFAHQSGGAQRPVDLWLPDDLGPSAEHGGTDAG